MSKVCTEENCTNPQFGGKKCVTHQWKRTDKTLKTLKRSPLKRTQSVLKRTRINPMSKKMKKNLDIYNPRAKEWKKEHPVCKAQIKGVCTHKTNDVHHKDGRGIKLLDESLWIPVCRSCHSWIDVNTIEARLLDLLI